MLKHLLDEERAPLGLPEYHLRQTGRHRGSAQPLEHPWFRAGEPPVLLSAGRLKPQKDHPPLLRAFARAVDTVSRLAPGVVMGEIVLIRAVGLSKDSFLQPFPDRVPR